MFRRCRIQQLPARRWHGSRPKARSRRAGPTTFRRSTRWPEYPRPQMVRPDWTNLNGLWNYAIRPAAEEQPTKWDGEILVPFAVESALSGVKKPVQPDERLWYRRTFTAPQLTEGGRLLLALRRRRLEVHRLGQRQGSRRAHGRLRSIHVRHHRRAARRARTNSSSPCRIRPTPATSRAASRCSSRAGILYTAVTGIWQTVWLEPVPGSAYRVAQDRARRRPRRGDGDR